MALTTTMACRSCRRRIGFIALPNGKHMPVDPELVRTHLHPLGEPKVVLITEDGRIIRGCQVAATVSEAMPVAGYVSHFATCSHPEAHRRP